MAEYDRLNASRVNVGARADSYAVDEGLRAYMLGVYNYMAIGMAITGLVAYFLFSMAITPDAASAALVNGKPLAVKGMYLTEFGRTLFVSPLKYVLMFAPLVMVFIFAARIHSMSVPSAQATFWLYAALVGASIASIFLIYTQASIARVFFITAASFGALSLWGYTTKKDLSGWGSFLFIGLVGVLIASIVNIFVGSTALQFAVSVIGVLVFAGLTAYDTQQIKEQYYEGDDATTAGRKSIMGALSLYLNFLNMFLMLLSLFGNRE
ncbi:MAG: Bax inhibitor-1/YccA family protein [Hyphomicrobiales bacterium]|nr:Bax inhibitor-1/YccA family protein [Hyphomicrobiales bacterium]